MAEVGLTVFLPKLYELLESKVLLLAEAEDEIRLLHDKLQYLSLFLRDADKMCNTDEYVKLSVSQIREVTYEAEDVIDKYLLERQDHCARAGIFRLIEGTFKKPRNGIALHEIGQKIKSINTRLDRISANIERYGIPKDPVGQGSSSSIGRERGRRPIIREEDDIDVVGIEDDANTVAKLLIEGESRRSIVSITGMGGLGKTTLARKVCNRVDVKRHFQCSAFIYVSQEFRVQDLLCNIIKCVSTVNKEELRKKDEEELSSQLSECLKGKVYLVVLDDIWSTEAWSGLAASFPNEANGSRILFTTRKKDLVLRVDPLSTTHEPRSLTKEECWELLCKKAFPRDHDCPHHLVKIGEQIVEKCHGLPLAVAVLGGLLSRKCPIVHEWTKVFDSIVWHLNESEEDEISSILALSYYDLPNHLKPCFLHFASFPEDYEVPAPTLIQMWVAEGFTDKRGLETMEDVAEDYLLELIDRSMIQVAKWSSVSRVEACRIHDLLRDLAVRKAQENMFLDVYTNVNIVPPAKARRLAITHHDISKCISVNHSHWEFRSLYWFSQDNANLEKAKWKIVCGRFKMLRVLHMWDVKIWRIPNEIGDLIYLTYLALKVRYYKSKMVTIPSNFIKLYNLQTFKMHACGMDVHINIDIWKLKDLRHLDLSPLAHFRECLQLYELTSLQTLTRVSASNWIKDDLSKLTSLRKLGIHGDVASYQAPLFESIGKLENLRCFDLSFNEGTTFVPFHLSHLVHLETLKLYGHIDVLPPFQDFPVNLTTLTFANSKLRRDPMAILEEIPKLEILNFLGKSCYVGKKMSCSANGFPNLKFLHIEGMEDLEQWIVEDGALPNLKKLLLFSCSNLKMVPDGLQHLTNLQDLSLYMPTDFYARIEENGEDWYKIKHIPSIILR